MDANAIGFADVLPIFWRSRLRSGYSGRRLPPFADRSAVTRQGNETTSGRIRPLHEIVRAVDVAAE
jgi:hypothetical protein